MFVITMLLSLVSAVSASFGDNLNYRSPSDIHLSLGVSIHQVAKRNDLIFSWDPFQLKFTHEVTSGDLYDTLVDLWTRAALASDND